MTTVKTETSLIKTDFDYNDSVVCPAGEFRELCKALVPEENIWRYGYGDKEQGIEDRGLFKVVLKDNEGNTAHGKLRFKSRDRNSIGVRRGMAPRTQILENGKHLAPKDISVGATWKKYLVLEFEPDEDVTIDMTNAGTIIEAPVTQLQNPDFR